VYKEPRALCICSISGCSYEGYGEDIERRFGEECMEIKRGVKEVVSKCQEKDDK
jgi:hypothetical protein